jgi:hypothetical protein
VPPQASVASSLSSADCGQAARKINGICRSAAWQPERNERGRYLTPRHLDYNHPVMRAVRLMLALLLCAGLAILPIAAAPAMSGAAMSGAAMAETGTTGHDCPCCKADQPAGMQPGGCSFMCCHLQAIAVESVEIAKPGATRFAAPDAPPATSVALRPDPPPPRA